MSGMMAWNNSPSESDKIGGDRRQDRRYDIQLDLRWKLIRRRRLIETGPGFTMDISSGGMLFDAGQQLPAGLNVELLISWPVMLHNTAPLQLVVTGRIVRSNGTRAAIRMTQHEFRTIGATSELRIAASANGTGKLPFLPAKIVGRAQ
jgi:c-di-GMP-binding flagellar brake protein YcgR